MHQSTKTLQEDKQGLSIMDFRACSSRITTEDLKKVKSASSNIMKFVCN